MEKCNPQKSLRDVDLSKVLDNARTFDGQPITIEDKKIIKGIFNSYFSQKKASDNHGKEADRSSDRA